VVEGGVESIFVSVGSPFGIVCRCGIDRVWDAEQKQVKRQDDNGEVEGVGDGNNDAEEAGSLGHSCRFILYKFSFVAPPVAGEVSATTRMTSFCVLHWLGRPARTFASPGGWAIVDDILALTNSNHPRDKKANYSKVRVSNQSDVQNGHEEVRYVLEQIE